MAKKSPDSPGEDPLDPVIVDGGAHGLEAQRLPAVRGDDISLIDYVANGTLSLPHREKDQKSFFRFLRRAGSDKQLLRAVRGIRDAVIREALGRETNDTGLVVALSGPRGGEGTSFLSLMLALSLGMCSGRRIAILDGRLSPARFRALTDLLGLSKNCVCLEKGEDQVLGFYNERHPNVYFLSGSTDEEPIEFFSDKRLGPFLGALRRDFDFTVIDAPPLLDETAGIFLAPLVDRLYLVAKAGKTTLADLGKCADVVRQTRGKVSGVVINQQRAPLWSRLLWKGFFYG